MFSTMFHKALMAMTMLALGMTSGSPESRADPVSGETRQRLDDIIANYRANAEKIHDLAMSGDIHVQRERDGGEPLSETMRFDYWMLGDKERVDQTYPDPSLTGTLLAGRTRRIARTNDRTLTFITDTQLSDVRYKKAFRFRNDLHGLKSLQTTNAWTNHAEHLEYLLNREWNPEKESIEVLEVVREGRPLIQVAYASTRGGGDYRLFYEFDPDRGYQVVSASVSSTYASTGTPLSNHSGEYQIMEVAPGVWYPVGGSIRFENWSDDGQLERTDNVIEAQTVAANSGLVQERLFTFEGMEVPRGMTVADLTTDPEMNYRFDSPPVTEQELDALLADLGTARQAARNQQPGLGDTPQESSPVVVPSSESPVAATGDRGGKSGLGWTLPAMVIIGVVAGFVFVYSIGNRRTEATGGS